MIETSPSLLLIHWKICLVCMNTMDMGVFLFAQNMLGTRDVAIKICNFKVPSTLRLNFYLQTGCGGSHHYWKKLGILVGCLLSPGSNFVYYHFVCTYMYVEPPKMPPNYTKRIPTRWFYDRPKCSIQTHGLNLDGIWLCSSILDFPCTSRA